MSNKRIIKQNSYIQICVSNVTSFIFSSVETWTDDLMSYVLLNSIFISKLFFQEKLICVNYKK